MKQKVVLSAMVRVRQNRTPKT